MSVSKPGNPNDLTEVTTSEPGNPTSLTGVANEVLPRSIQPYINFDFANNVYEVNNQGTSLTDAVTYSRASSATFIDRYIDENNEYQYFLNTDFVGTVTNKVLYSEDYGNSVWTKNNTIVTPNAEINPVTNKKNASLITNTLAVESRIEDTLTLTASATVNMSAYVKANVGDWMSFLIWDNSANGTRQWFNIREGYVGSSSSFGSGLSFNGAQILYVGNGWYRVSATTSLAATTSWTIRYQFTNANLATTSNGNESYYIWGAQLTETVKAEPYVQTFDVSASKTFSATPRLEYDASTGEALGYLVERGLSNLILRSEEVDNASWNSTGLLFSPNAIIAPDLTKSADKITQEAVTSDHILFQSYSVTTGQTYTMSVFAKAAESRYLQITGGSGGFGPLQWANFDLVSGVVTSENSGTAKIIDVGNGWYRCSFTTTATATISTPIAILIVTSGTSIRAESYLGDGTSGFYVWGAQAENRPYATSYIRTTTAPDPRSADIMSKNIGNNELATFHCEANYLGGAISAPGTRVLAVYNDNTTSNRHLFYNDLGRFSQYLVSVAVAAQAVIRTPTQITDEEFYSFQASYELNSFKIYFNGELAETDTNGLLPIVTDIEIGSENNVAQLDGHIKEFRFYRYILTDSEVSKI